jgi:hypothetical protein
VLSILRCVLDGSVFGGLLYPADQNRARPLVLVAIIVVSTAMGLAIPLEESIIGREPLEFAAGVVQFVQLEDLLLLLGDDGRQDPGERYI